MSTPFLSSEEYDERAHTLYNDGQYDDALDVLREGLTLYPSAVELHVGIGYARLAREEFAWARRAFDEALVLDGDHEDALAGLGEVLLRFGQVDQAMEAFDRTIVLGYEDDFELMLQIGRTLFREGFVEQALQFFERAATQDPESAEAIACIGYAHHRMGNDDEATATLRRAIDRDASLSEARVYLANLLYDAGRLDDALNEFERTAPEDHWDELGIWRVLELKRSAYKLSDNDGELKPWEARLLELDEDTDAIEELLAEVEQTVAEQEIGAMEEARGHLETLGTLLSGLASRQENTETSTGDAAPHAATSGETSAETSGADDDAPTALHQIVLHDGGALEGSWEEIVRALRNARDASRTIDEFMVRESRRYYGATGHTIAWHAPEAFIRGSADVGLLRIIR